MSKFIKNIALFLAGAPLLLTKGVAAAQEGHSIASSPTEPSVVPLQPLNWATDNLFAGHRSHSSHSSHASHSSHYSGSGGGSSSAPRVIPPVNSFSSDGAVSPSAPALAPKTPAAPAAPARPVLTHQEMLKLQIMRVQIALTSMGLYDGPANGVLTWETQTAIRHFQTVKGLPETGTMTTPTLNSLGVPAVN